MCSTVDVAVRIRQLVPYELENGSEACVAVIHGKKKIQVAGSEKSYRFNHVFSPDVNNERFYNSVIRNKVAEVLNDHDVTILAYGQRRSGKTHTMGTNYTGEENMGIIPRAIHTLFNIINSDGAYKYKVTVSFTELYNKKLYDLLASNKKGTERIVELEKNGSNIFGLTESVVTNVETAMQCLIEGSRSRVTSAKRENTQSTRSHAIFTITIYQRKNVDPRVTTRSKLHLVDLAGSKHVKKNNDKAQVQKDLLAIRNLIDHQQNGKFKMHTKYQSSKLAILLRDSLRENYRMLIIACVSPADYCLDETLQTLRYANRLHKIKRDFSVKQADPVLNKAATKMDANCIETKPNVVNRLEIQESTSTMDVEESSESETHDNIKAEWILGTQDSNDCNKNKQLNLFETELNIDTEDAENILTAQSSSQFGDCTYETLEDEVDDDWDASLIRNALKANECNTIDLETFQEEVGNASEANELNPDAQRILNAQNSRKWSVNKQESSQSEVRNDSENNKTNLDAQRVLNIQDMRKSSKIQREPFQREIDDDRAVELIQHAKKSCESSEMILQRTEDDIKAKRIIAAQDSSKSSKFIQTEKDSTQSETDADTNPQSNQKALESKKSRKSAKETFQSQVNEDFENQRAQNALGASISNKSKRKMIQGKTNTTNETQRIQDAIVSNKTTKSATKTLQTKKNEETDAESIHDAPESKKLSKTKKIVEIEIDNKTRTQSIRKILKSIKSRKFERRINPSESDVNMDDATKAESFKFAEKFGKLSEAQREKIPTERIEDPPSNLFSKIADFFLEPSPTEENELRKEIYNLRKKLREQTSKLKTNIVNDLKLHEHVGLSTIRRESAKLVVTNILEEFQEVLTYIVENSEIRDWIVRVFRRIRDLLDEQKKIAGKMLHCEAVDDETMDEKYAEHTMRQVDRYRELQGVNRCVALLEELVASLPKESSTIGDILRNLEDTTNQIKRLEIEKIDLVEVLKCPEPLNENRTLAEYGIDKVLEMDEKISRLWRRRIKQMIAIERREKLDQQIASMLAQIEKLKNARVRLVEEMKDAEKLWNSESTSGEKKKTMNTTRPKKTKNSKVLQKCACKVSECLSRRCSCVKNGMSCINCNCNAELCQNSDKEKANADLKCACTTDCLNRRCTCGKNGVICNGNCRCRPECCKNKNKENGTTEANYNELQAPSTSTDGKMKVDRTVSSLHVNSCVCRENGATCTNCNRSFKLREYRAKARRRLFADIDNENEGNERSRKRPRLGA